MSYVSPQFHVVFDDLFETVVLPQPPPAPNLANEGAGPHLVPEGDKSVQAHEGAAVPPAPNIE